MCAEQFALIAIGLVAGLFGGLLGVGGSVIMIPAMHLIIGPNQHLYQGAAMMVNFFVALPAVIQHQRVKAILSPIIRVTIPSAIVGVLIGVWLSSGSWFAGTNEVYLSCLFGGFLFYVAAYNLYRLYSTRSLPDIDTAKARSIPAWKIALCVGIPSGLAGGLLGIGGGAVAVPAQQVFLKMPIRRAIANSAANILLLSIIGAAYKNYNNVQAGLALTSSIKLALYLIPTAIVGGYIGGHLTHVLRRGILRVVLILLLCYGGYSLVRRPFNTKQTANACLPRGDTANPVWHVAVVDPPMAGSGCGGAKPAAAMFCIDVRQTDWFF